MVNYGWTLVVEDAHGNTRPISADSTFPYSPMMFKTREDARRMRQIYECIEGVRPKVVKAYFFWDNQ